MLLKTEITEQNGIRLVAVSGRIDSTTYKSLEQSMQKLFDNPGTYALLNLSAVDYVSSAGLRVILMAAKRAKKNQGRLVLCGLQPDVEDVFKVSGFLAMLEYDKTPTQLFKHS